MQNKLLPCPFCGGKVKLDKYTDVVGRTKFGIVCKNEECDCLPFTSWWASKEDAIKSWNTRKPIAYDVERLFNAVSKTLLKVYENITIQDVDMYKLGYNNAVDEFADKMIIMMPGHKDDILLIAEKLKGGKE